MIERVLLDSEKAVELYNCVKNLPIIDYHNHLSVDDIEKDTRFLNICDLWIKPDPYKHRAMRMYGIEEKYITGDAPDKEKFVKWCSVFPYLIGNPLYIWSLMELERVFGISEIPNKDNAENLYDVLNEFLAENEITPSYLLKLFNVEIACPCISITSPTENFDKKGTIRPSLRGDDILIPNADFIKDVSEKSGVAVKNLDDYKRAICILLEKVEQIGCKFTDHALDDGFTFYEDDGKNEKRFQKAIKSNLEKEDKDHLFSYLLLFVCEEYAKRGFTTQLHIGAKRETSDLLRKKAGAQGGFAAIGNNLDVNSVINLLNALEKTEGGIGKIVLFALNPTDNAKLSILSGSFSKDGVSGLITQGPAWWWCDHKKGICDMLENNAVFGAICNFVGMTTDSRSFLSLVRHDYFRRILCSWYAEKCEKGEFLNSDELNKKIINKLCYENAKEAM
ncbi:MAG: glucuronate isomerase [Clostridia bacterium]|nr:glucuronate isomerase [Clostridia bacterium]